MKIGIITGNLNNYRTGIGTYIYHLIQRLKSNYDITLIRHETGIDIPGCDSLIIKNWFKPGYNSLFWNQSLRWQNKVLLDFDLIHNAGQFLIPPLKGKKTVLTVHDITPILFPEYHFPFRYWSNRIFFPSVVKNTTAIIADSHNTKRDLCSYYHIPSESIQVIHLAADSCYCPLPLNEVDEWKKNKGLMNPYILFVGTIEPRKNISTLLKAFALILMKYPEMQLVLAGSAGWNADPILREMNDPKISGNIRYLQYLAHEELPYLYNGAVAFVYPSWYEGFGLPPLEAMQCGVPVICSNSSSLPEIIGPGGILIDPGDVNGYVMALDQILTDDSYRKDQITYGICRSSEFTWKKTANETAIIYNSLSLD